MTDIFKGATSNSLFFELVDSTTGLPKTGIVYTDVTGSYVRTRSARVAITMATLASASAAFSSGGFILIDDTNQPGIYRIDVPDAAFATGVFGVVVTIKATGCRTQSRLVNLVDVNNQVAYAPNVAAAGVGGLLTAPTTANTGLADVTRLLGTAWLTPGTAGTPDVNAKLWNGLTTVALPLIPTVAGRTLDVSAGGEAGLDWANIGSPTTTVAMTGTTIATTQKVDVETIKTNPVVNAGTVTFPTTATLASTTNITAGAITTVTTVGSVTGLTAADVGSIKTKTDFLPSVTAGAAGGVFIAGANAATSITTALTANIIGNITGNLSGSIGSYTGDTPQTGDSFARIGALGAGLTALATAANLLIVSDGVGYLTSALLGTISDAGTAGETYVVTFGSATYTLDYTGLDSSGNRTGVTRTKT